MIEQGQNIYDFCLEKYGTLENIFNVIDENSLTLNSDLNSGQELNSDTLNKGDNLVKLYISNRNIKPNNNGEGFTFLSTVIDTTLTETEDLIQEGQNIFDIAIQEFGGLEFIFNLLDDNNFTINTYLNASQILNISNSDLGNQDIKDYVKRNNYKINNGITYPTTGSQLDALLQWPEFIDKDIIILPNLIVL